MRRDNLLIGCAAGFSGDRLDAARPVVDTLVSRAQPAVLIFETLAERTLALAQLRRSENPDQGYEPQLDALLRPVLADCLQHGIPIVSNFGAANPAGAARRIAALAAELGLAAPRIAVIEGDDLSGPRHADMLAAQMGEVYRTSRVVTANAYIGAQAVAEALRAGAQIVVGGRLADPALALGPALAHFGWAMDDWDRLARATMVGHLLECGAQVCGGYFADPGYKDVTDLHVVGFPIAEIDVDGHCVITKADGTGGLVSAATVKEQLLYELHDPARYLTPDVVADITEARVEQLGPDRVALRGVRGHPCTGLLKVTALRETGWLSEGEISYAGPGAEARARLAAEVLRRRLPDLMLRVDLIGVLSVMGDDAGSLLGQAPAGNARDVRLRVAASHTDRALAERLGQEVNALYTCGPAGGGGVRTAVRSRLGTLSCTVPSASVPVTWRLHGGMEQGA